MTNHLLNFSEEELVKLLELTEFLGYMPAIDMEHVDYNLSYDLELRIIPIIRKEEE